jgi:4-hydroxyphenylpyruvate dioxygenase
MRLMCDLGVDLMLVCWSVHPAGLGGIMMPLAWGRFIYDRRDAWQIVRRANHPNIGLILDSFHTLGRKLAAQRRQARARQLS